MLYFPARRRSKGKGKPVEEDLKSLVNSTSTAIPVTTAPQTWTVSRDKAAYKLDVRANTDVLKNKKGNKIRIIDAYIKAEDQDAWDGSTGHTAPKGDIWVYPGNMYERGVRSAATIQGRTLVGGDQISKTLGPLSTTQGALSSVVYRAPVPASLSTSPTTPDVAARRVSVPPVRVITLPPRVPCSASPQVVSASSACRRAACCTGDCVRRVAAPCRLSAPSSTAQLPHPSHTTFHKTSVSPEDAAARATRFYRWHIDAALYDLSPPRVMTLYALRIPRGLPQVCRYDDGMGDALSVLLGTTVLVVGKTV
ncbi:hypothetical protein B0H14DRAFT_3856435 [Mycena olivaceomarginata]|nr:hypothetical protein B0H14DRAFT_3856435 [Mycena olivaceomarginata]